MKAVACRIPSSLMIDRTRGICMSVHVSISHGYKSLNMLHITNVSFQFTRLENAPHLIGKLINQWKTQRKQKCDWLKGADNWKFVTGALNYSDVQYAKWGCKWMISNGSLLSFELHLHLFLTLARIKYQHRFEFRKCYRWFVCSSHS